jgi:hypothetical protein
MQAVLLVITAERVRASVAAAAAGRVKQQLFNKCSVYVPFLELRFQVQLVIL